MTKTLTKTTLAALALGLSVPAMAATDGTPGTTSTGSLEVTLQVNPPAADTVHIFGLENQTLPSVTRVAGSSTSVQGFTDYFCIVRTGSNPTTNVSVTITQAGGPDTNVFGNNGYSLRGTNGEILTNLVVGVLGSTGGGGASIRYGVPYTIAPSGSGCTSTSGAGVAHQLSVDFNNIPDDASADGALSQTFTLTVSMPS